MFRIRNVLVMASTAILLSGLGASAAATPDDRHRSTQSYDLAIIGDTPYGPAMVAAFPSHVDAINADPSIDLVAHLGDIKSGSSLCTNDYFSFIRDQFDRFDEPVVYTPGDNEWTDCHRPAAGGYNPLERLDRVRSTFFDHPGRTLGRHPVRVRSQQRDGYPENVLWSKADVTFAAVHILGSNNSLVPWTGNATATPQQTAEVLGRTAAGIENIHDAFDRARDRDSRAVVIMMQADMFDPTVANPTYAGYYAFTPVVEALVRESERFAGPVYLIDGDSHVYNVDHPLAAGSTWLDFYGVQGSADRLTRITVDGDAKADNYLRFSVSPRGKITWTKVPFGS